MLTQHLTEEKTKQLLKIARLFTIFEAPLLNNGKEENGIEKQVFYKLKFHPEEMTVDHLESLYSTCKEEIPITWTTDTIDSYLRKEMSNDALQNKNDAIYRLDISKKAIKKIIEDPDSLDSTASWPFATEREKNEIIISTQDVQQFKIILLEIILFCISAKILSNSKMILLKFFSETSKIEDQYFDEVFSQAMAMEKEISKTINLIME